MSALSEEVSRTLKQEAGKDKVQKAEKLNKSETIQYEFLIVSGKLTREIVDPAGEIVKAVKGEKKETDED